MKKPYQPEVAADDERVPETTSIGRGVSAYGTTASYPRAWSTSA
jgi:hypothetical protein